MTQYNRVAHFRQWLKVNEINYELSQPQIKVIYDSKFTRFSDLLKQFSSDQ